MRSLKEMNQLLARILGRKFFVYTNRRNGHIVFELPDGSVSKMHIWVYSDHLQNTVFRVTDGGHINKIGKIKNKRFFKDDDLSKLEVSFLADEATEVLTWLSNNYQQVCTLPDWADRPLNFQIGQPCNEYMWTKRAIAHQEKTNEYLKTKEGRRNGRPLF